MQTRFTDQDFFPNFYERLGIEKNATATEIVRAYKQRAMETHPDRHPDDQENATKQFVAVGRAYEILKDPGRKSMYDRELTKRAPREENQPHGRNAEYKADFTKSEFYKDFTYSPDDFVRYREAADRMASGQYRRGDLSTVFNFVAGNRSEPTPKLQGPKLFLE